MEGEVEDGALVRDEAQIVSYVPEERHGELVWVE